MDLKKLFHNDCNQLCKKYEHISDESLKDLKDCEESRKILFAKGYYVVYSTMRLLEHKIDFSKSQTVVDMLQSGNMGLMVAIDKWLNTDVSEKFDKFPHTVYQWSKKYMYEYLNGKNGDKEMYDQSEDISTLDGYGYVSGYNPFKGDGINIDGDREFLDLKGSLFSKLTERELLILKAYYNIDSEISKDVICEHFNITPQNLRIIVFRIIKKIKKNVTNKDVEMYNELMVGDYDFTF